MRTTVDIPDETYRELKIKAAREGSPVRQIVLRGIQRELEGVEERPVRASLGGKAVVRSRTGKRNAGFLPADTARTLQDHDNHRSDGTRSSHATGMLANLRSLDFNGPGRVGR